MKRVIGRLFILLALLWPGWLAFQIPPASAAQQTVRIGAFNFYPGIFKAKDGSIQGFYVDTLAEIARLEGWRIEYVYGNWADGIARIKNGEVDLITSVAWTSERAQFLDYGKVPLLTVWGELYVPRKASLNSIKEVEGKRVAVMKGDFNGASFRNMVQKFGINCRFVEYGNFEEIFQAIVAGRVDAGVVNNTFGAAKQYQYGLVSSGIIFNPFDIFLATAKGRNPQLLATLDSYLASWRRTQDSPYHKARERWSHGDAASLHVVPPWLAPTLIGLVLFLAAAGVFIILLRLQVRKKTSEVVRQAADRKMIEDTLFFINECGARQRADELLYGINRYLAGALDADYAFVAQLTPDRRSARTHGFYARSGGCTDITYRLAGTPCDNVVGKSICVYPQGVTELFPEDEILRTMAVEGYAAVPLWDSQGEGIGLLGVMSRSPLRNSPLIETLLGIASSRAAQELEAMHQLSRLADQNAQQAQHIAEKKRSEELLLEYLKVIECSRDLICVLDRDYRYRMANGAFLRYHNLTTEQVVGRTVAEVAGEELFAQIRHHLDACLAGQSVRFDMERSFPERGVRTVTVTYTPVEEQGGNARIACVISDQTEKKHLEEQLRQSQKMEAIGHLAGGIAHDFNNILTVIVGYGNFLDLDGSLNALQHEQVGQIIAAAERGSQLTRGLLTFSRKQVMNPRTQDLNALVGQVQKFLLRIIGEDVDLQFTPAPEPLHVLADGSQLEQVLVNLSTNARDAMPDGGTLTIETCWQQVDEAYARSQGYGAPGRYACIIVSDSGSGMDRATRDRIFEPFFSTKEVGKGTGLGMSIVYGIVKQHKGFINVYSEPGEGTTFKVYLPEASSGAGADASDPDRAAPVPGTETILVAEDDAGVRGLVESLLKKYGYQVVLAMDGNDCVEKFLEHRGRIDLILMDVIMPGKNGKEAFDEIKRIDPAARVLYSSGYTADFMKTRGVFDDNVELIMKPVQPMTLLHKVRELLDRRAGAGQG
ncbi:ATP-binding protein [Geomonas anaerohicana]|uniref:histidine kinase n=1 Tax=Geomonas anaerohicana TaxID=2798583 RepID=A0ABS0YJB7_9BACT|nr:transporter substrate-binding domain-containing protein [Geomonas anaerohicana]MBJ6752456.1 transporter substrate-binding domain-containing protein [Geomonas anaerohicana]